MMGKSIPYRVSIDLYEREYRIALQAVQLTLTLDQMKLVKEAMIARDWFTHCPWLEETHNLTLGDFEPATRKLK